METIETDIWSFGSNLFTGGLLAFIIEMCIALCVAKIIMVFINRAIKNAAAHYPDKRISLQFLKRILRAAVYIIAVFSFAGDFKPLSGLGTAVLGATSIITVIIGLAAQETFGNFIAGFFLAMYQPFKVGDLVVLPEKNIAGTVRQITFRHTELYSIEGARLIVPNSIMSSAIIEDKAVGSSSYTTYISFDIGYDSDERKAEKLIYEAFLSTPNTVDTRSADQKAKKMDPFQIRVESFAASGITLKFPLVTTSYGTSFAAASDLRKKLLVSFRENGIEIPYQKVEILKHDNDA
jgi:small-conductance mechanosensitive channel